MQRPAILVHGGAGRRIADAAVAEAGCAAAAAAGWAVLSRGGSALDAVLAAVTLMEDDGTFNAGHGSCLTAAGTVEMDASIMDGAQRRGGGAAVVSTVRNPILLARAVMLDGRHVLLAGPGADAFALRCGLPATPNEAFITPRQRRRWEKQQQGTGNTVGAVAIDGEGHLAAATSTGGRVGKLPGRIGDSAILGAGTYADDRAGAASATGDGEAIIIAGLTKTAVDGLAGGRHPADVAAALVRDLKQERDAAVGLIVVDRFGRLGTAHSAEYMSTASHA